MTLCLVCGNRDRDISCGDYARLIYNDPEFGIREYQGRQVKYNNTIYFLFLVDVSDTELARIEKSPRQHRGGRKYSQDYSWYVSYNPNTTWPGTNLRASLECDSDNSGVTILDSSDIAKIK